MAGETHAGYAAKAYYNTGSYDTPTWVEITMVKDATINVEDSDLDASTRAGAGNKLSANGLRTVSADVNLQYQPGLTDFDALRTAYWAKTGYDFAFMDGDIATTGTEGVRFFGNIFSFGREEPLDGLLASALTIRPVINTNGSSSAQQNPEWYEIS